MSTLNDAKGEIQRADHLLFVTLKYTRTIDVMKSVIARLANAYDNAIIHALEVLKKKKKFKQIPLTPVSRAELLRDLYKKDIIILDAMNTYFFLRKVAKAEYTKKEEFRKNVTLTVMHNEEVIEVNIKVLEEYYNKTKEFIDYINEKFK
ncbi:MAG: hypothetical protein QT11_C0001G0812 [archaeon GW2011_AR20]|nr:MAG: hypothetical protein QT11_C0001G0812 [archaeon GW2011_AR20]MBS3160777.1 hypothetical protein [Candidatus Woesearchaeota archaeon]